MAIYEGLKWLDSAPYQAVELESDTMLVVQAIMSDQDNMFEVGFIIDACREAFSRRRRLSLSFTKRQANRAARLMARVPCLLDCQSLFTSLPLLFETLLFDTKF